jgi:4-oxalocrotonate tautomerase
MSLTGRHGFGGRRNHARVTWVKVDEIESGDWAIGGQCLTTHAVKDLAAGKAA